MTTNNVQLSKWCKEDLRKNRRQVVLRDCHGNRRTAGRTLMKLSKESSDPEIRRKARADAMYFFKMSRGNGNGDG